jgi:hypothetical protein
VAAAANGRGLQDSGFGLQEKRANSLQQTVEEMSGVKAAEVEESV